MMNQTTIDWLKGCARFLRDRHRDSMPTIEFVLFGIATEFLRAFVDNEWTNQMVFGEHSIVERRNRAGRVFMKAESESPDEQYRNQERAVRIAELLFNLQHVDGFDARREELCYGNVESTYSELEAGAFLLRRSLRFRYVTPTGIKGADYDAEIPLNDTAKINCEMKCKIEETDLSVGAVRNPLQAARKQLPSEELGLVFLKLPEAWTFHPEVAQIVNTTVNTFLSGTSRVIAVVLRWEEQHLQAPRNGALFTYKFRVELGKQPRPVTPSVDVLLAALAGPATGPWVSFRMIAEEAMNEVKAT